VINNEHTCTNLIMSNPHPDPKFQWKKGQSGNPGGRPKGKGIKGYMNQMAAEIAKDSEGEEDDGRTNMQKLVDKVWEQAIAGDNNARDAIFDRMEGKPRQIIEMADADDTVGSMEDDKLESYIDESKPSKPNPENN